MLTSKLKNLPLKQKILLVILTIVSLFFVFQLFLPVNSKAFVFKSSYGIDYSLNKMQSPTSLVFEKDSYLVNANKNAYIKFNVDSNEASNQIYCTSDDPLIADAYSTSFGEIILIGINKGNTKINIFSSLDHSVKKTISVVVTGDETLSYDGIKTPSPCYTIDDNLVYENSAKIDYGQKLKLNYVVKNSIYTVVPTNLTYEVDDQFAGVVDSFGNVSLKHDFIGKDISIKVYSKELLEEYDLQPIIYRIHIDYPNDYGVIYLSSFITLFITYILSFCFIGLLAGKLSCLMSINSTKLQIILFPILLVLFSTMILLLHTFALGRQFAIIYWFVSTVTCCASYYLCLDTIRSYLLSKIKGIFYE